MEEVAKAADIILNLPEKMLKIPYKKVYKRGIKKDQLIIIKDYRWKQRDVQG